SGVYAVRVIPGILRIAVPEGVEIDAAERSDRESGELLEGDGAEEVLREPEGGRIEGDGHVVILETRVTVSKCEHSGGAVDQGVVDRYHVDGAEQRALAGVGRIITEILAVEAGFRLLGVIPGIHAGGAEFFRKAVINFPSGLGRAVHQLGGASGGVPRVGL